MQSTCKQYQVRLDRSVQFWTTHRAGIRGMTLEQALADSVLLGSAVKRKSGKVN